VEPLELLATSELFDGASPADFEPLAQSARIKHYNRGDLIWVTGDKADQMFLVLTGEVVASRLGPDGEEYVVDLFAAGDVMGSFHFFEPLPLRFLDARAADVTSCWVIQRQDFMHLLERNPKLMMLMLRAYSRWIVRRDLQDADSSFRNVAAQVATRLLHLADQFGEPSTDGMLIRLHVTETTLANMIGASRENVSRAIAKLQRAGDVRRERGLFVLPHPGALRARHSWVTGEEARAVSSKKRTGRP
jgi:CRP/FNR family transcriptional regulator, cyclic AMP receptor protein